MIPVPEDIYPTRLEHRYVVEKDVVQKIEVVVGNVDIYRLPEFLKNFGQPREIWVATYSRSREGSLPFTVVLYYPDQGILARFGSEAKVEGDLIVGCPQEYPALNLVLWSPDRKYLSFEEAVNDTLRLSPFEQWGYQRLEEISNLDTGSFNEVYKAASNLECIHTEASYWPSP